MENVVVKGAPGLRDFVATAVPGMGNIPVDDSRESLAVVVAEGETLVVPTRHVQPLSQDEVDRLRAARLYRARWATLTGRPERAVYVPDHIRPRTVEEF